MSNGPRRAILVLGMHRSGTSALTRLLGYLGAAMPADAIARHADNARGYWESVDVVRADDALLRAARSSWFDPRPLDLSRVEESVLRACKDRLWGAIEAAFGDAPLFALKDPRQCRFVPLVLETLVEHGVEARAVLTFRSAEASARSLERRDGTTPAYAQALWLRHLLDAERATRALHRVVVDYDDMVRDWRRTAARLIPLVGGTLPEAEVADAITSFIDPNLRHHGGQDRQPASEPLLTALVADVTAAMHMAMARDDATVRQIFDGLHGRHAAMRWLVDDIVHEELRHRRVQVEQQRQAAEATRRPDVEAPPAGPAVPASAQETDLAAVVTTIRESGLFDEAWYAATYPEAETSGLDPIEHYVMIGAAQGLNPHPLFDTAFYAQQMIRRIADGGEA